MTLEEGLGLERVLAGGDEWQCWRALKLTGEEPPQLPRIPGQEGGCFRGPAGRVSAGATGEALCHLVAIDLGDSDPALAAADWLEGSRTPAQAWLDHPAEVPGELDTVAGARVWATAAASCALLALRRDPGARALDLLRGEADLEGRFTGGAYPTFAAAGAYWLAEGPKTEMAEWGLRWAREWPEPWWGPGERATALTFWAAARIPAEHASVEPFLTELSGAASAEGFASDLELTLRALELLNHFEWAR